MVPVSLESFFCARAPGAASRMPKRSQRIRARRALTICMGVRFRRK
jgi:hypothetical protein